MVEENSKFYMLFGEAKFYLSGYNDSLKKIFDNIVIQAMEKGLVGGKILYSDSTHIKANANKRKFEKVEVQVTPKEYIEQLDIDVNLDRENHNTPLVCHLNESSPITTSSLPLSFIHER